MVKESLRKGVILAGGEGTRLSPITSVINKHLLPVCEKPMIYYPLTTLMLIGVKDILIITNPFCKNLFEKLLGDGNQWGINLSYKVQNKSNGIAHGISLAQDFIGNNNVVIALGDNIFHGSNLFSLLRSADLRTNGATIFACPVRDPERYGVVEFEDKDKIVSLQEKPRNPKSQYAITGIYFFDNSVCDRISNLKYSSRNELEITSLNSSYLEEGLLNVEILSRGIAWFDTGTFESLQECSDYIRSLQHRQGLKVGSPEEVAWRHGWINNYQLEKIALPLMNSGYGQYLLNLISNKK